MAKTGPLGKAEMFYIEEKFKAGIPTEQIALDLDRAVGAIQKYTSKINTGKSRTIVEQQFIKQGGATVMTENASSMIDQKKRINSPTPNCITKIK